MKTYNLKMPVKLPAIRNIEPYLLTVIVLLLWYTAPVLFELPAGNSTEIATSISLMVLLAMISFLLVLSLCWWLLHRFWTVVGLPGLGSIVLEFKSLQLWQQLGLIVHCGLIETIRNDWIYGIEANTNLAGSREGEGVYRRARHVRTISKFADWVRE